MTIRLKEIPREIGVYLFYDGNGRVIYVGKAINLRRRVSQYFNASRKRMEYRIQQMSRSVADIKWLVQKSELHALLLEDRLIKKHWPMYNARQKKFLRNRYLTLSDEDYPRLRILDIHQRVESQTVFGPFPDDFFVLDVLEIIHACYPIRNCDEAVPRERCQNYKLMTCSAPCRNKITRAEYQRTVKKVLAFLRGDTRDVICRLRDEMESSMKKLDFERAAKLRDQMVFCKTFTERQGFYDQFRNRDLLVREWGSSRNMYLFHRGHLIRFSKVHLPNDESIKTHGETEDRIEDGCGESDSIFLDRANVVYSWLKSKRTQKTFEFI